MWKWFAPLLIFAGKPEVLLRLLTLAIAAAVVAFGVWLFSNVALTFDALKNPYIEAAYGVVLACFFIGVGTLTWLRVRRLASPQSRNPALPVSKAPPLSDDAVQRRAADMAERWSHSATTSLDGRRSKVAKTGFKNTRLVLVDTPGINEAAGELRGKLAEETVRYTDLVLFVVDGDLNRVELDAFTQLSDLHKPIVLVINKADLYGPEQIKEISASILRKIGNRIGADDIVLAAAAPRESEREIHKADGTIEIRRFQPQPKIEVLEMRMLEVLDREGKAIIALNASLFASDVSDHITALKQHVRGKEVTRLIYYFMLGKALVVGANPVPVFDILAGMATDALMVQRIGAIYGTDFSLKNAQNMVLEILRAWGLMAAAEYGLHLAADLLRTVTFGTSTVLTAVPQGLAAAWSSYIIGNAANIYFRDSGWGGRSPKDIVHDILAGAEKEKTTILGPIRDQLTAKFGRLKD